MCLPQDILALIKEWLMSPIAYVEVEGSCLEFFDVELGTLQGLVVGPVLFNLFISPLLESRSGPSYADDSYHLAIGRNKAESVIALQGKIIELEGWLSGSGLKVNLEKTELTIFHRHNTGAAEIREKTLQ